MEMLFKMVITLAGFIAVLVVVVLAFYMFFLLIDKW